MRLSKRSGKARGSSISCADRRPTSTVGARSIAGASAEPSSGASVAMLPLDAYPERLRRPLQACAAGRAPANIALMQFLIEALDRNEADTVLTRVGEDLAEGPNTDAAERLRRLGDLWAANPQAFDIVKSVLAQVDHGATAASADEGVSHWASLF